MIEIDRIELADIANPVQLAKALLDQLPDLTLPVPIHDIATALDIIEIKPMTTSGFEGGLITDASKSTGCILVNQSNSSRRQRFTIGHELGHYLNPWHTGEDGQFMCKSKDMVATGSSTNNKQRMEIEANQFSAELLMPAKFMRNDVKRLSSPDVDHIVSLANNYDVSKESMGRRYIDFQEEPCTIIFSYNGIVSYTLKNQYFPRLSVWAKDLIPNDSITKKYNGHTGSSSDWVECACDTWLSDSNKYASVYEQVLTQDNGHRITLITLGEEADEDDENLADSWHPRFAR